MFRAAILLILFFSGAARAAPEGAANARPQTTAEFVCALVNRSAKNQDLPVTFLTRLIWQESSFRPNAISPAGAQGIAQFMPGTAGERGLANPFDPEEAIPKAAQLLSDLKRRFGNLGLAAAAYNGGPARVANWLAGNGALPMETRDFVLIITRHPVEDWTGAAAAATIADSTKTAAPSCLQVTASIRRGNLSTFARSTFLAPWGVQLAGSFSKAAALAAYGRARSRYSAVLGNVEPIVLGSRVISRGFRPYYRIRAPALTRAAADALCDRIMRAGGACAVLRN